MRGAHHDCPTGHYRCDGCNSLSTLYAFPIICTECQDEFCENCIVGTRDDDERGSHGVCHRCYSEDVESILSHRERRFVTNLKAGLSGEDAARRSGYLAPAADAERLLQSERIKAALAVRR